MAKVENTTPMLHSVLRPSDDKVVARVVDGEAIMINLATGVYYSMKSTGAFIWELLAAGHPLDRVAAAVAQSYTVSREQAEADVLTLAATLVAEQLVHVHEGETAAVPPAPPVAPSTHPYDTPKLDVYRDIGHLVALDPPMPGLKDLPWKGPTDA